MNVMRHRVLITIVPFLLSLVACQKKESPVSPPGVTKRLILTPGDTLGESLADTELSPAARTEIIAGLGKVFNPRRCRAGDYYDVALDSSPLAWSNFRYYPPGIDYYTLTKSTDGAVTAAKMTREAKRVVSSVRGEIQTSLWESLRAKNIDPELIVSFAEVFAWQIDFLTEPRVGDTYRIVWEQYVTDDNRVLNRQILAAQYNASGDNYTAFLFDNGSGQKDYYGPDGKALRSAFLKAPLQFRRISSFFSRRRFHPVLKYYRPHLGIDYAAPTGTPVSAIGEGTVLFAGRKGGFGIFIQVRHPNGYTSCYGHLSRISKGIRPGVHVRQGQVIGSVGATGLASGPHLDFRIQKGGAFLNFLKLKFPSAASVSMKDMGRFNEQKKPLYTQLSEIR